MSVIALGLNHATAPLDLRGRFAFAPEQLGSALHGFRERLRPHDRPEAALLSTCNRTEVYVHGTEPQPVVTCWRSSTTSPGTRSRPTSTRCPRSAR